MDGPTTGAGQPEGAAPSGAQPPRAPASATKPPAPGIFDEISNTFAAARRVISSFIELASLEAKRAALTVMWMVVGGVIAAILAVTAWWSILGAVAFFAVSQGLSWIAVFALIALVNLAAGAILLFVCVGMSRNLLFTVTRRQLSPDSDRKVKQ